MLCIQFRQEKAITNMQGGRKYDPLLLDREYIGLNHSMLIISLKII